MKALRLSIALARLRAMTWGRTTFTFGSIGLALALAACSESGADGADSAGTGGTGGSAVGGSGTGGTGVGGTGVGGTGVGGTGVGGNGTGGSLSGNPIPGTENYNCDAADGTVPALTTVEVASGLSRPILVTHAPNDTERLFVIEQAGVIRIINLAEPVGDSELLTTPFLDIQDKVNDGESERGLLGLAFHPDYAENGLFYVHYSAEDSIPDSDLGDTIIEEYQVSSDANVADEAGARIVYTASQPDWNHNGGTIAFGPDGFLYIFLGDGGGGNDQYDQAQTLTTPLGKILRMDPTAAGAEQYSTPEDNLIQDEATALPEIWSYGLRNPYRANFDACTGDLYIGDVGQDAYEEVNVTPNGTGRLNYGWPIMEGEQCRVGDSCDQNGLTLPEIDHSQNSDGVTSIIGGAVYRGSEIPAARGTYFYADLSSKAFSFIYAGGNATNPQDLSDALSLNTPVAVQNGGDGEIYFVVFNGDGSNGMIRKLVAE